MVKHHTCTIHVRNTQTHTLRQCFKTFVAPCTLFIVQSITKTVRLKRFILSDVRCLQQNIVLFLMKVCHVALYIVISRALTFRDG